MTLNTPRWRRRLIVAIAALAAAAGIEDSALATDFSRTQDISGSNWLPTNVVPAGTTTGIVSWRRFWAMPTLSAASGSPSITEATILRIDGAPVLSGVGGTSYALHVAAGLTSLDGPLKLPALTGPASLVVDAQGDVATGARQPIDVMHAYCDNFNGLTTTTWMVPGPTTGGAGLAQQSPSVPPETRLAATPVAVRLLVHNLGTPASGCETTFAVSKSGSAVVASELAVTHSTANDTFQDSGIVTVSASSTDSWGLILASAPSNGSTCNWNVYVTAYFYAN